MPHDTSDFLKSPDFSRALQLPEYYKQDVLLFFNTKPDALILYNALFELLKHEFTVLKVKVQKSQISFYNRHLFAMVSLPRKKSECGIVVSFGTARKVESPRIAVATEPYPNRWTHHLTVTDVSQLDTELLGWLQEAYDFAACKP